MFDILIGWGTVKRVNKCGVYPIEVKFDNSGFMTYTDNGYDLISNKRSRLFHTEHTITDFTERVVWVRNNDKEKWQKRVLIKHVSGTYICWGNATTIAESKLKKIVVHGNT